MAAAAHARRARRRAAESGAAVPVRTRAGNGHDPRRPAEGHERALSRRAAGGARQKAQPHHPGNALGGAGAQQCLLRSHAHRFHAHRQGHAAPCVPHAARLERRARRGQDDVCVPACRCTHAAGAARARRRLRPAQPVRAQDARPAGAGRTRGVSGRCGRAGADRDGTRQGKARCDLRRPAHRNTDRAARRRCLPGAAG